MKSYHRQYLQRSASSHDIREINTTQERDNRQEKWNLAQANVSDLQCIECVKAVPVFSLEELDIGDHVVFDKGVYTHHGILVSKPKCMCGCCFKIIEATNTKSGFLSAIATSKLFVEKAEIMLSLKKFDLQEERILVVVYKNRFSNMDTALNALLYYRDVKRRGYQYNVFTNNCEHFATYCATGHHFSLQVAKVKLVTGLFFSGRFPDIRDERARNEKQFRNKLICEPCYKMNRNLLSVRRVQITSDEDIKIGDIIQYIYFGLWHDAVVLSKIKTNTRSSVCSIAHYAFGGLIFPNTIKEETKTIYFCKKFYKLDYTSPRYDIYAPGDVVKRAKRRIGEQLFVYFSNDSSHFARWCKLKLWMSRLIFVIETSTTKENWQ